MPLNPKTLKPARKPSGKQIYYGIQGPKGKVSPISIKYTQKFSKRDLAGLNRIIKDAKSPKDFIYYEELTREVARDEKNKVKYRKRGKKFIRVGGKKVPEKKTKITFAKSSRKQQPILRVKGKTVRGLDLTYRKRSLKDRPRAEFFVKPTTGRKAWSQEIFLTGKTIYDTINKIQVPITLKEYKKIAPDGLAVMGRVKVTIPGKETVVYTFHTIVKILANFAGAVSHVIRVALANHGLRFTSMVDLAAIAEDSPDAEEEIFAVGRNAIPADTLEPIYQENEFGYPKRKRGTGKDAPKISVALSISPA